MVKLLLARGADVKATTAEDWTALHAAADKGHIEVVNLLLTHGADPVAKGKHGRTALHAAAEKGHIDVAKVLLVSGADMGATDKDGRTPLHKACERGSAAVAHLLIQKGANMEAKDSVRASNRRTAPGRPRRLRRPRGHAFALRRGGGAGRALLMRRCSCVYGELTGVPCPIRAARSHAAARCVGEGPDRGGEAARSGRRRHFAEGQGERPRVSTLRPKAEGR